MSALKLSTEGGLSQSRPNSGERYRKTCRETSQIAPRPGGSLPGQAVYAHSVNTKRNVVGPSICTPNAQGMVAGIVIHALENGRLELLAEQACEN
jgi:hypothetical protein